MILGGFHFFRDGERRRMTSKLDFPARLKLADPAAHTAGLVQTLMLNVGRRCDLACPHCHHRCSPETLDQMTEKVMRDAIDLASVLEVDLVDVTGGSPELWPHLPELVTLASARALALRVRTNLVPLGRPGGAELVALFAEHDVTLLASVSENGPSAASALRNGHDGERRRALELLGNAGYGNGGGLAFELAVNPEQGLPRPEDEIAAGLAESLAPFNLHPARVLSIANVPLGRYGDQLEARGERRAYLHRLADAFDERAVPCLPCRSGLTVGWDGKLYDCDFNVSAGLPIATGPDTVTAALDEPSSLASRPIAFGTHCFACTIGSGSG